MEASIVDLRYHMNSVLQALDRNETVKVLYRGKLKATLLPASRRNKNLSAKNHPCFGMTKGETNAIEEQMNLLRGNRYAV